MAEVGRGVVAAVEEGRGADAAAEEMVVAAKARTPSGYKINDIL